MFIPVLPGACPREAVMKSFFNFLMDNKWKLIIITVGVALGVWYFWPSTSAPSAPRAAEVRAAGPARAPIALVATPDPLAPIVTAISASSADTAVTPAPAVGAPTYAITRDGVAVAMAEGNTIRFGRDGFANCANESVGDCSLTLRDNGTTITGTVLGIRYSVANGATYTPFFHGQVGQVLTRKVFIGTAEVGTVVVSNMGEGRYAMVLRIDGLEIPQGFVFDGERGTRWNVGRMFDNTGQLDITSR